MPWSTRKPTAIEIAPDWLKPYCEQFLHKLVDQGYAPATMRTYEGAARLLCEEVARRGLRKGELVGQTLSATHAASLEAMHPNKYNQKRFCLESFIGALVEAGVAERPKPKEKALTPLDRLQVEYESYLRDQRGLTDATIYHCVSFLKRFMAFRFGETLGNFDDITPHDVVDFLRKLRGGTAPRDKTAPSHLRNLFRFLFWSGKTKRDLAASIPRARQPAKSALPRYLKPEEVEKLLDAAWAPIAATFTPEVFCCSVPVVGITNLQTLLESMPPYWAGFAEFMYRSYGDPRTPEGRALLSKRSPIHKVDRIKKPMLIFHGANDVRCKVAESDTIVAAMQAKSIPVTYVVFPDEGHGFHKPPNRLSYLAIAEAFFARHLGGACEPVGRDFDDSSHEVRAGSEILLEIGAR